jgi:hypothetical protein
MHCAPFETDIRHDDPNESGHRHREFRKGWTRAVAGECYGEETLLRLTWNNLGYRLGAIFGPTTDDQIDDLYGWYVRQQRQSALLLASSTTTKGEA